MLGSKVYFTIAPVAANGKLVYWSTSGTTYFNGKPNGHRDRPPRLRGRRRGRGGGAAPVRQQHAAGRDADLRPGPEPAPGDVHRLPHLDAQRVVHRVQRLLSLGRGARVRYGARRDGAAGDHPRRGRPAAITQPWVGITSFSPAHWAAGDHMMVAPLGTCGLQPCNRGNGEDMDQQSGLAWFDLESAAAPTSTTAPAAEPARHRRGTGSTRRRRASTRRRRRGATTAATCCSR